MKGSERRQKVLFIWCSDSMGLGTWKAAFGSYFLGRMPSGSCLSDCLRRI